MPGMDGLALCRALRGDASTKEVPILVVSGQDAGQLRTALDAGCDAVLAKLCTGALLVSTIEHLLARLPEHRRRVPLSTPGASATYSTYADTRLGVRPRYWRRVRCEAIFITWIWSSVSHASTPRASASEHPSRMAASCVEAVAWGGLGTMLISCSSTAVGCETSTSPDGRFANDLKRSFDMTQSCALHAIRAVPSSTRAQVESRRRASHPLDRSGVLLAAVVNWTLVAGENLTVGSTVWLPAASLALGR